jgi:hypothetical protein
MEKERTPEEHKRINRLETEAYKLACAAYPGKTNFTSEQMEVFRREAIKVIEAIDLRIAQQNEVKAQLYSGEKPKEEIAETDDHLGDTGRPVARKPGRPAMNK